MGLDKALKIAVKAHAGQKDRAGEPYMEDNMSLRRLHGLAEKDGARMGRYQKAYRFLTGRSFES